MGFIKTLIFLLLVIALAGFAYIYSGSYNIAATAPHSPIAEWIFKTIKNHSIKKHAEGIERPRLNDEAMVRDGFVHYEQMCAGCHGAPGKDPAQGFNPSPPELSDEAEEMSSAELFWIIKNGIKMTGMPAYGPSHSDDELWTIVAFLKTLPDLGEEGYSDMIDTYGDTKIEHDHDHSTETENSETENNVDTESPSETQL